MVGAVVPENCQTVKEGFEIRFVQLVSRSDSCSIAFIREIFEERGEMSEADYLASHPNWGTCARSALYG